MRLFCGLIAALTIFGAVVARAEDCPSSLFSFHIALPPTFICDMFPGVGDTVEDKYQQWLSNLQNSVKWNAAADFACHAACHALGLIYVAGELTGEATTVQRLNCILAAPTAFCTCDGFSCESIGGDAFLG